MAKRGKRGKRSRGSTLAHHQRAKGTLTPPLMTLPGLMLVEWLPTQFPDMLWPCSLTSTRGLEGCRLAMRCLETVSDALEVDGNRPIVDGRLTNFERLDATQRAKALESLFAAGLYDEGIPEEFVQVLGMYPGAPGAWLIEPWRDRGVRVDPERAEAALSAIIVACASGRTNESTWAKAVAFGGLLVARKLSFPSDMKTVDLLPRYGADLSHDENARVESFIRASFGAVMSIPQSDEDEPPHQSWARRFWDDNWRLYACRVMESPAPQDGGHDSLEETGARFRHRVEAAYNRVLEVARTTDPGLYAPDRHEVLTGIVSRACRIAYAVSWSPIMWSGEHGASPLRAVLESHITLRWLGQHADDTIFVKFKEYGRGKLKLTKLHYEEHLDAMDDPPEGLRELVEELDRRVNQDTSEEFQTIEVGRAFGKDLRRMARDVGMEDEYRLLYQPQSDVSHGEWTSLDYYSLQRCGSPTHRWHRLPREELGADFNTEALGLLGALLEAVVDSYVELVAAST